MSTLAKELAAAASVMQSSSKELSTLVAGYLSLPPTRHDLTQGQKPEGQLK